MEEIIKISGKNQIVIPKSVRKSLGVGPGDELIIEAKNKSALIVPRPKNYTEYMRGLGAEVWSKQDATEYVKKERESWEEK